MQKYDYGTRYLVKDVDARIAELEEELNMASECAGERNEYILKLESERERLKTSIIELEEALGGRNVSVP